MMIAKVPAARKESEYQAVYVQVYVTLLTEGNVLVELSVFTLSLLAMLPAEK